jgi:hypothetical protein
MGMGISDLKFLLSAKDLGFSGRNICTLGRQSFFGRESEINRALNENGLASIKLPNVNSEHTADDVLGQLGYKITSVDVSPWEGATIQHDLNYQIPQTFIGKFDLVMDNGTLEHIFNYPIALKNAMQMVREGGQLMLHTPVNNLCGHGFYQFSPELFYRALSPANGFQIIRMYIHGRGRLYHVADPIRVHGRVTLSNSEDSYLMVHARKIAEVPFRCPQQSDYVASWNKSVTKVLHERDGSIKSYLSAVIPKETWPKVHHVLDKLRSLQALRQWRQQSKFSNRCFYIPVTDWSVSTEAVFPYEQSIAAFKDD